MPIFEYKCADCEKIFERVVLKIEEEVECRECGSPNASRIPSVFGRYRITGDNSASVTPKGMREGKE